MNFFGHAAVTAHFTADACVVLGAMLPDFANMIAARPPSVTHPGLAAGVRFHHATDEAFHELTPFVTLSRAAFVFLGERGLRRGSARAVAHVGVELLIDEVLAQAQAAQSAYLAALEVGRCAEIEHSMSFREDERERFAYLVERLTERGIGPTPPAAHVAERLRRVLGSRPRLAFTNDECVIVEEWIVEARPSVVASVPILTEALLAQLGPIVTDPPAVTR